MPYLYFKMVNQPRRAALSIEFLIIILDNIPLQTIILYMAILTTIRLIMN